MMNKQVSKQLESLKPGDLVCVEWADASTGKSLDSGMMVDIPVRTWGVYMGVLGQKSKHIVLAQNSFKYSNGLFDIDYTAVPVSWTAKVVVLVKDCVEASVAKDLLSSFLTRHHRATANRNVRQKRVTWRD